MEKFANLSPPVKWTLGLVGGGALIGAGAAIMSGAWMFILTLVLLLVVLLGGYVLWTAWRRKLRSAQLGGELAQHSSASPRGISDPGQRARLDDMRKKFETGVREYKARGKDLYKLPWYAIVGEPGSGKTEAVRHSNVGFPPGMQDEFQGVGGTINMNWWFTNHAVLLDTAGRLMFEEVKPGETSEWKEFLTLLKKNRPNCPINGLLLVIPSDSLIKDSADDIQRKAGKIAQQLDVIQRVLDVRFPVFVIVTKCDKVNGFREFFDGVTDPQLQHQMMGWSNPSPLDDPFRPDLVDQHLNQVVQRLRKRRLGLLRDPVPENTNGRRTDEVDSLYALPHSLSLIAPRLRRYLETIFVAGEWSSKPLFLRGIYFSSSMREGSALDAELAEAIGMPVDELPEGKVWERERAYFLRDLFVEKVFRERGLVTRASNTALMLRTQQIVLFGCSALALVLFLFFAWFGTRNLKSTVKNQSDLWVNATNWSPTRTLKQSIIPQNADNSYTDTAISQTELSGRKVSLAEFHMKFREQATNEMKANWMMPYLAGKYNRDSKRAQRIVFEGGLIKPLVEAARKKMERSLAQTTEVPPEPGQTEAFLALLRLEGDLLTRDKGANKGEMDAATAGQFLSGLSTYVTGQRPADDANFRGLVDMMVWTYSENTEGRGKWPPAGLSGAVGPTNSLAYNPSLRIAFDLYLKNAKTNTLTHFKQWAHVSDIVQLLERAREIEPNLFRAAKEGVESKVKEHGEALNKVKTDLDKKLDQVRAEKGSLFSGRPSLTNAYAQFSELVGSGGGLGKVYVMAEKYRLLLAPKEQLEQPLFTQIIDGIKGVQAEVAGRLREVTLDKAKSFSELDQAYLVSPAFIERGEFYQAAFMTAASNIFQREVAGSDSGPAKVVQWERFVSNLLGRLQKQREEYAGVFKPEFLDTAQVLIKRAERMQRTALYRSYIDETKKKLGETLGFPLARTSTRMMTPKELDAAHAQLIRISQDVNAPAWPKSSAEEDPAWHAFVTRAGIMVRISQAILGDERTPGECTISLMPSSDATKTLDSWRQIGRIWRHISLIVNGGFVGGPAGTEYLQPQKLGTPTLDKNLTIQLIQTANEPNSLTSAYPFGDWGAIALLLKHKNPAKTDPKTWIVNVPIKSDDGEGAIRLELKFDRPFPELDTWPE